MGLHQIRVDLCSIWGGDRSAAVAAWASSFDRERAEARSEADVMRVVTDVVHLHHDTPKERLWVELFITCPIYVERQLDKYRMSLQFQQFETDPGGWRDWVAKLFRRAPGISWLTGVFSRWGITQNELSGRYRTVPDRPYLLPQDVAEIISKTQPFGSWGFQPTVESARREYEELLRQQHRWYQNQLTALKQAEKDGRITNTEYKRARDVLRGVFGMAYLTDMRWVLNMNAFEHVMNQRLARDAQLESRVVAYWMFKALEATEQLRTMLTEMVKANGWAPLLAEIEAALAQEPT